MKLLTTGGLLFATAANASNSDGNYGAYPMIDWAAIFNEGYLKCNTGSVNPLCVIDNGSASLNNVGL